MAIVDVKAEITGSVWKIVVKVGDRVTEDQPLVILESMKMEIPLMATEDGVVIITGGLKAGQSVVTDGQMSLKPGLTVAVQPAAAPASSGKPAA